MPVSRKRNAQLLAVFVALGLGCDGQDIPANSTAQASSLDEPGADQLVRLEDVGASLRIPDDWIRLDASPTWSPSETGEPLVGVKRALLHPPQEPEALLLPSPSQVTGAVEVNVDGHLGRRFTLEVFDPSPPPPGQRAPVISHEIHVLVVVDGDGGRQAFDFYVAAESRADLLAMEETFDAQVASAILH